MESVKGSVAVVTGASRGIGRAIALAYGEAGIKVVCTARSSNNVEIVAQRIRESGGEAIAITCDITSRDEIEALYSKTKDAFGGIDIVVVNAGMAHEFARLEKIEQKIVQQSFDVNFFAALNQAQLAIPFLRERGGGKILFMGSGSARGGIAGLSAYAASKAALSSLSRTLATELRRDKIAVNEIVPGPVKTAMIGLPDEVDGDPDQAAEIMKHVPDEWLKAPKDVASLALFLAGLPNDGPSGQVYSLSARQL